MPTRGCIGPAGRLAVSRQCVDNIDPGETTMAAVYPDLAGKVVLVTGGATGIGAAIVRHFARQKSAVIFFDINDEAGTGLRARALSGERLAAQFSARRPDRRSVRLHVAALYRGRRLGVMDRSDASTRRPPLLRDTQDLPLRRIEPVGSFHLRKRGIWCMKLRVEFPSAIAERNSKCMHFFELSTVWKGEADKVKISLPCMVSKKSAPWRGWPAGPPV